MVRSDARENRARILAAAREALTEDADASMNRVAQLAGVGAGTLYRDFPNREALVLAIYQDEVDRITGTVPDLLSDHPPLEALRIWTSDLVEAMRRKRGLGHALSVSSHDAITQQTYGPVIAAITQLLDAGKQDGSIRADADPVDYLQLTGALWRPASGPEDRSPHMLALVLDGLTAGARSR